MFVISMLVVINLYWLFGVERYETYDIRGVPVTTGHPNTFGILILIIPLVIVTYWYWKKYRGMNE